MSYRLTGFLSFRPEGACFLMPVFSKHESNGVFLQDLGEAGQVKKLNKVDVDSYSFRSSGNIRFLTDIGKEGLFAARLNDSSIRYGTFNDFRAQLMMADLERLGSAFFNVDAFALIGAYSKRRAAITIAKNLFSTRKTGRSWASREKKIRSTGLQIAYIQSTRDSDRELDEEFNWLQHNLLAKEWPKKWIKAWSRNIRQEALYKLAMHWIKDSNTSVSKASIIGILLNRYRDDNLMIVSVNWLSLAPPYFPGWAALWVSTLMHARRRSDVYEKLIEYGSVFLIRGPSESLTQINAKTWISVWTKLKASNRVPEQKLLQLIDDAVGVYGDDPTFQKRAILPSVSEFGSVELVDRYILPWMRKADISSSWISVFGKLYEEKIEIPDDIFYKAHEFIESGNCNLSGWKTIWDIVKSTSVSEYHLQSIADRWLNTANPAMNIWPEILVEVYQGRVIPPDLMQIARLWLDFHDKHRRYTDVQELLSNNERWQSA